MLICFKVVQFPGTTQLLASNPWTPWGVQTLIFRALWGRATPAFAHPAGERGGTVPPAGDGPKAGSPADRVEDGRAAEARAHRRQRHGSDFRL